MMTNTLLRGVSRSSLVAVLALCSATAAHADATPECNDALGPYRTECGTGSHAGADVATAVGASADVTADGDSEQRLVPPHRLACHPVYRSVLAQLLDLSTGYSQSTRA